MNYAKEENGVLKYPTKAEFRGIPNYMTNDTALRKKGYLPLRGVPEQREGFVSRPSAWHVVSQSIIRVEPRPQRVEDWEEDPETHERRKTGEHVEMVDTELTVDTSYIQVDEWGYEPVPEPPAPVVRYSKYKIQLACQKRGLWEQVKAAIAEAKLSDSWANIQNIASDNDELAAALPLIKQTFGSELVDEVLSECVED